RSENGEPGLVLTLVGRFPVLPNRAPDRYVPVPPVQRGHPGSRKSSATAAPAGCLAARIPDRQMRFEDRRLSYRQLYEAVGQGWPIPMAASSPIRQNLHI